MRSTKRENNGKKLIMGNKLNLDLDAMAEHADAAVLLSALSNRSRLMVLCILSEVEHSAGELHERVPLSQSAMSQHLAKLRRDDFVDYSVSK